MTPVLFGSRALARRVPDARAPRDWDVIARAADVAHLGPPGRTWPNRIAYDLPGSYLEIVLADELPWATFLLELKDDALVMDVPLLGPARVADLPALLVLKMAHAVYPVSFYKSLADYHFLRGRAGPLARAHHVLLGLVADNARTRYADTIGNTHAPPAWALTPPDAHTLGPGRADAIRQLADEARALAERLRGDPAQWRWALRVLATRVLPLPWRYFTVDAWPEIEAYFFAPGG